jgi:hypothetical protein
MAGWLADLIQNRSCMAGWLADRLIDLAWLAEKFWIDASSLQSKNNYSHSHIWKSIIDIGTPFTNSIAIFRNPLKNNITTVCGGKDNLQSP